MSLPTPYYESSSASIWLGDCREILPCIHGYQHVITDPPFASAVYQRMDISNHQYSSRAMVHPNHGAVGSADGLYEVVANELGENLQRWALIFSDVESLHLWREALVSAGLRYVRTGAWVKTDPMPQFSGDRPGVGFEPLTIAHAPGKMWWNAGGLPAVWRHGIVKGMASERLNHPCQKPLGLMETLISQFTDRGDSIIDPFCGTGTTLRAAKNLGRRAIGIEIEERYAELAAKRLEQEVLPI